MQTKLRCLSTMHSEQVVNRQFDPYVCFSVQIGRDEPSLLYWRLLDPRNLLEIGVDARFGKIVLVKLVLFRRAVEPLGPQFAKPNLSCEAGLPVFDTSMWRPQGDAYANQSYYHDVEGPVGLAVGDSELLLRLFPEEIVRCVMFRDSVTFHLNRASELCAVQLHHLTSQEMDTLRDYLEFHQ